MTGIYVIRHAEAEGNLYRIAQGQYNSNLTDRGWRQLQALSERFQNVHLDAVYASDLYRAFATASAVARPKGLAVQPRRDLREICVGEWEERPWGRIAREQPEQLEYFNHRGDLWHVDGCEDPAAVQARMTAAVREIARTHPGQTVALASHGCAIRLLLGGLQGYTLEQIGQTPTGGNTAVSYLEAEGDAIRVVFRDDTSHVPQEESPMSRHTLRTGTRALEPGLYYEPAGTEAALEWICGCVHRQWDAVMPARAWDESVLRQEAAARPTLLALQSGEPAGVVQLSPEKEADQGCGWISLCCLDASRQNRGLGVQLLGQAVGHYRPLGRERLRLCLPEGNVRGQSFFAFYGFSSVGRTEDGRVILEKDIRFRPL